MGRGAALAVARDAAKREGLLVGHRSVLAAIALTRRCRFTATAPVAFAVWAPNARRVSVIGEFNGWDNSRHCQVGLFSPVGSDGKRHVYEPLVESGA